MRTPLTGSPPGRDTSTRTTAGSLGSSVIAVARPSRTRTVGRSARVRPRLVDDLDDVVVRGLQVLERERGAAGEVLGVRLAGGLAEQLEPTVEEGVLRRVDVHDDAVADPDRGAVADPVEAAAVPVRDGADHAGDPGDAVDELEAAAVAAGSSADLGQRHHRRDRPRLVEQLVLRVVPGPVLDRDVHGAARLGGRGDRGGAAAARELGAHGRHRRHRPGQRAEAERVGRHAGPLGERQDRVAPAGEHLERVRRARGQAALLRGGRGRGQGALGDLGVTQVGAQHQPVSARRRLPGQVDDAAGLCGEVERAQLGRVLGQGPHGDRRAVGRHRRAAVDGLDGERVRRVRGQVGQPQLPGRGVRGADDRVAAEHPVPGHPDVVGRLGPLQPHGRRADVAGGGGDRRVVRPLRRDLLAERQHHELLVGAGQVLGLGAEGEHGEVGRGREHLDALVGRRTARAPRDQLHVVVRDVDDPGLRGVLLGSTTGARDQQLGRGAGELEARRWWRTRGRCRSRTGPGAARSRRRGRRPGPASGTGRSRRASRRARRPRTRRPSRRR